MSEARKKLIDETREWLKKGGVDLSKEFRGKTESEEDMILRIAEIKRQEEQTKVKIKAKREEYKRLINREVGTLNAMAKDEDEAAIRYRNASNDSPLPTMKKLLLDLGAEEQAHAQRLRKLTAELAYGLL
jgi:rubrerythrin